MIIEFLLFGLLVVIVFAAYKLHYIGAILAEAKLLVGAFKDDIVKAVDKNKTP